MNKQQSISSSSSHVLPKHALKSKLFLIEKGEYSFLLEAVSKRKAIFLCAKKLIPHYQFFINSFAKERSLFSIFYRDKYGVFNDPQRMRPLPFSDHKKAEYISEQVKRNIHNFWADRPDLGAEYTREFVRSLIAQKQNKEYIGSFTEEFYIWTIIKLMASEKGIAGKLTIREIDSQLARNYSYSHLNSE
ncbi:hypothetical protein [Pseudobacillus badius]|uniref:hypothetical protein n=1 Tax=Bacillus badius TaxID=1455 RepID=UPI003D33E706